MKKPLSWPKLLTGNSKLPFTNVHKDKFSLLLRGVGSSLPSCRYKHMARITLFRTEWDTWHYPSTSFPPFPDSHNGFLRHAMSSLNCPLLKHIIPILFHLVLYTAYILLVISLMEYKYSLQCCRELLQCLYCAWFHHSTQDFKRGFQCTVGLKTSIAVMISVAFIPRSPTKTALGVLKSTRWDL